MNHTEVRWGGNIQVAAYNDVLTVVVNFFKKTSYYFFADEYIFGSCVI